MLRYLRHYFAPSHRDLTELALQSWREYTRGKKRVYNMDVCTGYQRRFVSEYRHHYALAQLARDKQS